MINVIQKLANKSNYGKQRETSSIKYIVVHYTGNDGDKAWNNANYFATHSNLKASAHYFVDDNYIYQSVPDNYIAYSVGDKTTGRLKKVANNSNTLNVELCDTEKNGVYNVTDATKTRAIELVAFLMYTYHISIDSVIRHYDITGKHCPSYWVDDKKWESEFKQPLLVQYNKKYLVGWIADVKGWWYRYEDGTYPKSQWLEIDGKWYYFKADGYMAQSEYVKSSNYATDKKLYWVDGDGAWNEKSYRWMQNEVGWWLAEIGGKWYAQNEWAKIDDAYYYFDEEGYMVANRIKTIDGNVYQFRADGSLIE